jgi:hypothetical protein
MSLSILLSCFCLNGAPIVAIVYSEKIKHKRDDIVQVKSRLGLTNPSNVKESINRLNGLLKAKECIRDIHSVINDLEKDID